MDLGLIAMNVMTRIDSPAINDVIMQIMVNIWTLGMITLLAPLILLGGPSNTQNVNVWIHH
ncbi:MAG: hypothetical protein WCE94_00340 [Candidatus Methanoperedens sp.]